MDPGVFALSSRVIVDRTSCQVKDSTLRETRRGASRAEGTMDHHAVVNETRGQVGHRVPWIIVLHAVVDETRGKQGRGYRWTVVLHTVV